MTRRKIPKLIHLAGTVWFIVCVGFIVVLALLQAGVEWWIVFSLSGHGALIVLLLISLYLFAIYRGISSSQNVHVEHPLTSTTYYSVFYVAAPFLGGFAGFFGTMGVNTTRQLLLGIALGTFITTFLVWVIIDPLTGLLEMLSPASRKHRIERLAGAKAQRERRQRERQRLLAEVFSKEKTDLYHWRKILKPKAEKLAKLLLKSDRTDFKQAEREAVDIGANAWQIGGLSCMRELRDMAMAICKKAAKSDVVDYISVWWDGIGTWRNPSF